jgi:hypothetical protein
MRRSDGNRRRIGYGYRADQTTSPETIVRIRDAVARRVPRRVQVFVSCGAVIWVYARPVPGDQCGDVLTVFRELGLRNLQCDEMSKRRWGRRGYYRIRGRLLTNTIPSWVFE